MTNQLLRPGILVSLKTKVEGGVRYERTEIEPEHRNSGGESVARWETIRRIDDPEEHARAVQVRSAARNAVARVCVDTAFGLLCPKTREPELDSALAEAKRLAAEFNESAAVLTVAVYVLRGEVVSDEEATRAIASEVTDLLAAMEQGIRDVSPEAIRKAAAKAKEIGTMLDEKQARRVDEAVAAARQAARQIVKRVEKGGEDAAAVAKDLVGATAAVSVARFAFLDLGSGTEPAPVGEALPEVNVKRLGSLDFGPEPAPASEPANGTES